VSVGAIPRDDEARFANRARRRRQWEPMLKDAATYALLGVACFLAAAPMVILLTASVTKTSSTIVDLSGLLHPTFENYRKALFETPIGTWMINSLIVATAVTFLILAVDSLAGYAFARRRFPGREALFVLLLSTMLIPGTMTLLPLFLLANSLDLLDTLQAQILPLLAIPVGVFLMRQFFATIPVELEDAARIDGMSDFGIFLKIMLPLSVPGLATLGLFTFISTWGAFLWPVIVSSSDDSRVLTSGLATFRGLRGSDWGLIASGATLSLIPMLIIFVAFQKYLMAGILGGRGGKG
jgi:multiple sugar transport system permease protein